ncbi:GGDEF domain-containing protein [Thalassotalea sp. M1531]|uniref:diguanylate cyclase n=1 Tax=Thalassotalea algicola TaxID=2716224 RepID=A0A7Y0L8Y3_9GAMM|nr:GGDEF domain-containing protein [Thalassotalea algicola]NMP30011.1 GGDEF domain-containing protein [Thalassotalea algicola]
MLKVFLLVLVIGMPFGAFATQEFDRMNEKASVIEDANELRIFLLSHQKVSAEFSLLEQVKYWHMLGMAQDKSNEIDNAYQSFTNAIRIFEENQLPLTTDLPLAYIERSYMQYLKTYQAKDYCGDRKQALELIRALPEEKSLTVKFLVQNAFCFADKPEQLQQGIALLDEAIATAKQNNLENNLYSMIYNALGHLYNKNQLYDKAYEYLTKAYDYWKLDNDYADMFNMQHTLVSISIQRLDMKAAQGHVNQLFMLAENHSEFPDFYFFSFFNKGLLDLAKEEYLKAYESFGEALSRKAQTNEKYFVKISYEKQSEAAYVLGRFDDVKRILANYENEFPNAKPLLTVTSAIKEYLAGNIEKAANIFYLEARNESIKRRQFIQQSSEAATFINSQNLLTLDNKVLQQTLEINSLMLSEQQNKNSIVYLSLSLVLAVLLGAILFIHHLVKTRRAFKYSAQTDYLTGIANRRHCFEQGEVLLNQHLNLGYELSLMVFDIDHFKKVNDTLGHDVGDNALKMVVEKVKTTLRKQDVFGRIGGEEFLVILPEIDIGKALEVAERLNKEVATLSISKGNITMPLSVSIGVAKCTDSESLDTAIARADKALYQAKSMGRNRVVKG